MSKPHGALPEARDAFGNRLEVGDMISYGVSNSSSIQLMLGRIEAIDVRANWQGPRVVLSVRRGLVHPRHEYDRRFTRAELTSLDRVIKLHPEQYGARVRELAAVPFPEPTL